MGAQLKATEGAQDATSISEQTQLKTSTPVKLFASTKKVNISYDTKILAPQAFDGYYHVGLDHVIQSKEKIIIAVKALSVRNKDDRIFYCLGFAPKGVIETSGNHHIGMFINGWCYHNSGGNVYANNKQCKSFCPVALNQTLRLELYQNVMNVYIENQHVGKTEVDNILDENKHKQFYPAISVNGKGSVIQIVDFKVQ